MNKKLILLTSQFPYGTGETFLENEFPFLENEFKKITIFSERTKGESRVKESMCTVKSIQLFTLKTRMLCLFNKEFYIELKYLKNKNKLNISTFRTAWYSLSKAVAIAKQLESTRITEGTVFYSYWFDEKAIALALLKKKRNPKLKIVSRTHGWDVYEERHLNNYLPYRNLLADKLDSVHTISENGNCYLTERYPIFKQKIHVSRLGTLPLKSIPKRHDIKQFKILSISSIIPLKRVDKILELVSGLPEVQIKWTHIGFGSELEKLNKLSVQKSKDNRCFSFELIGQISNSEVREILGTQYFDLFINLSKTEGIPVSIMEAQSAGIPVLATSVGGTPEIVNKKNGILVDKDLHMGYISRAVMAFLNDNTENVRMKRDASYNNWNKHFNAKKNYPEFIKNLIDKF